MATEVTSLAYYVFRAKKSGISKGVLSVEDYHAQIEEMVDLDVAASLWYEMHDESDGLVRLDQITLDQADFLDILEQIYNGVPYDKVTLSKVPPAPPPIKHEPYFPRYLATISKDTRTPAAVMDTVGRVNEVIDADVTHRCNGLVVGRVQSGKTRNYIGLMLKAADEGWNVIIVLTSAIRSLALQTRNRIVEEFAKSGVNNMQHVHELDFLSSKPGNTIAGAELNGDFFYWGVSMKQVDGLERIKSWFNIAGQPHDSMRVMIIDDEADNATPDSNTGGADNLDEEEITERIEVIGATPSFEKLAEWFNSINDNKREWPDINANTPAAETLRKIDALLKGNKSRLKKRDAIVKSADFRHFLCMDDFTDPPVQTLITDFFSKKTGKGDNTCGAFVLLLKSILDIARERSAINAAVCALIGENSDTGQYTYPFARCAYLGYTATPYANILNESPSHSPIYADFIQSLSIPPQYFGTEAIFGCDLESVGPRMPIVAPITDSEQSKILTPLRAGGMLNADTNLFCRCGREKVEWRSLKDAVAWAFCTAAVRRHLRGKIANGEVRERRENRWTTMIVNIHHVQAVHGVVKNMLEAFVAAQCAGPKANAEFVDYCHEVWTVQTEQFTLEKFNELFNGNSEHSQNYGDGVADYPTWEEILPDLKHFLKGYEDPKDGMGRWIPSYAHAIVINSTPTGLKEQAEYNQDPADLAEHTVMELTGDHLWIVSGGNTIGRGLTLPGLTVSYFDRVRSSTCVDTLTQMGRWFGYRPGYELLPRVWMNLATMGEMTRIAALEMRLHESIAHNFAQHYSPKDSAHYQHIDCWGRGLSGHARAMQALDAEVGTIAATNDFYDSVGKRAQIYGLCEKFVAGLGEQKERDAGEYLYSLTPLWENIDHNAVRSFIESLLPCYPDGTRKILRGIVREINGSDPVEWDVVIGNPKAGTEDCTIEFAGRTIHCGAPSMTPVHQGIVRTRSAFLYIAFYAMIRSRHIWDEDWLLLEKYRFKVAAVIKNRQSANNGILPRHYDEVLPGGQEDPIEERLGLLIQSHASGQMQKIPSAIHARLGDIGKMKCDQNEEENASQGGENISWQAVRRRSEGDYMARVHKAAGHARPTLQLYLFRPDGKDDGGKPMVSISFYWPGHVPDGFFTVCVDENPNFVRMVTPGVFCRNVEEILRERDFPVQRKELLRLVLERFGLRCNGNFFDSHIVHPLPGFKYHRMNARNAYCIDGWAEDEERRLDNELLKAAIEILQRENRPIETKELLDMIIAKRPKFRDFYSPEYDITKLNALMTPELMNANDITVVGHSPVTYRYHN